MASYSNELQWLDYREVIIAVVPLMVASLATINGTTAVMTLRVPLFIALRRNGVPSVPVAYSPSLAADAGNLTVGIFVLSMGAISEKTMVRISLLLILRRLGINIKMKYKKMFFKNETYIFMKAIL